MGHSDMYGLILVRYWPSKNKISFLIEQIFLLSAMSDSLDIDVD